MSPEAAQLICNRHVGVGADGILLVQWPRGDADFGVRIINPDGSDAEQSGNGMRIYAKFLREHGYTFQDSFTIDTAGGMVFVQLVSRRGLVHEVTADMGAAEFHHVDAIDVDGRRIAVTALSIGNPHCVVIVDDLAAVDVRSLGPKIESHPAFPAKTNVQLAEVLSRSHVALEVWERGAGHMLASGTSACAAVAAAHRKGLVDDLVGVTMPGGELEVTVGDRYAMRLRGPVEEITSGDFSDELLAHLSRY
jgi:diaminopimelate epimerase